MKIPFYKAFLCLSLLLLSDVTYAQSDDSVKILLEKTQQGDVDNNELPKRDLDIFPILPTVLYNATNNDMVITSHYLTFESVAYCIVDEYGLTLLQGELTLRKGDEAELHLPQLSVGTYKIVLDFSGDCFQGEFEVEQ